jgi:GGDEF domain-containing protein
MVNSSAIENAIYFENDGEIDLLTGSMAPNRFNQTVKRDIDLANRNSDLLAIISLRIDLPELIKNRYVNQPIEQVKLELESLLIELNFKLKSILRSSDCISRVSVTGFWILINSASEENLSQLAERINKLFPKIIRVEVIQRINNQDQASWYEMVDKKHFGD